MDYAIVEFDPDGSSFLQDESQGQDGGQQIDNSGYRCRYWIICAKICGGGIIMTTKNMSILCLLLLLILAMLGAYLVSAEAVTGMVNTLAVWITIGAGIMLSVYVIGASGITLFKVLQSNEAWLTSKAHRRLAERDATVLHVVANRDQQIFVRDSGTVQWQPIHLPPADSTPLQIGAWQLFHSPSRAALPAEIESQAGGWPERVNLLDLLPPGGPTLSNLVLGVTMTNGQQQTVAAPLGSLIHIICAGASGWGKSMAIRSIAYQLATAPEPVQLVLMDRESATFTPFTQCGKLLYPIADGEEDMKAILQALIEEMEHRKELFSEYPTVERLDEYNRIAPEPLAPIMTMIDEFTSLMEIKVIQRGIRTLAQRARKYGLYLLLAGQSMKHDILDTGIRDQFSTIIQMKTNSRAQSQILLQSSVAHRITNHGRGYAILAGREMMEVQSPYFTLDQVNGELGNGSQELSFPKQIAPPDEDQIIRNLIAEGINNNQICKQMGLTPGGKQYAKIDAARVGNGSN